MRKDRHIVLVTLSCPTLCEPMDYSLPGFSVHKILQARILACRPFPSPGDLCNPGIEPRSSSLWWILYQLLSCFSRVGLCETP